MATLNGGYESLIGNINSFVGTYDDQYLNTLTQMDSLIPDVKKNGINSTSTEQLHNVYNDFTGNVTSNISNINSYYDSLLEQANSNTAFTNLLNEQGVETTPAYRKEIAAKRQAYINKIESERAAAQKYFTELGGEVKSRFAESGYSPKSVKNTVNKKNYFMKNEIMPEINSLNEITSALNGKIDLGTQEIQSVGEEYIKRIQNPDITQKELNKTVKDFTKWSKDYQRGYAGDVSSEIAVNMNTANEKIAVLQEKLKSTNYNTEEAQTLLDNVIKDIDGVNTKLYADGGAMSETAFSVATERLTVAQRLTGTGQTPTADPIPEAIPKTSGTPNKSELKLVRGGRQHRLEGTPIADSNATSYMVKNLNEDELIAHMTRNKGVPMSPSDYLLGEANPNSVKLPKPSGPSGGGPSIAGGASDTFSAKKLLKKHGVNSIINLGLTLADYKESRREGQGVIKSAAKAGVNFAIGETLGMAAIPFYLAGSVPTMAVKAVEGINKMERQMNSVVRTQPFADTYFQDTQQLATMRQSGMEMAKMSQYNLQQTLMGAEATHLHR